MNATWTSNYGGEHVFLSAGDYFIGSKPHLDPEQMTDAELSALLDGWNPDTAGQNNRRQLLLTAVYNRVRLGRMELGRVET